MPGTASMRGKGAVFKYEIPNQAERLTFRNRRAFVFTDTELKLIAADSS
jgi:hypothetical protein